VQEPRSRPFDGLDVRYGFSPLFRGVRAACRRGLWPPRRSERRLGEQVECRFHRSLTNRPATDVAEALFEELRLLIAPGAGKMDEPDGLLSTAAAGTGNAGDRDCDIGARTGKRAVGHSRRGFGADSAEAGNQFG